MIGFIIKTALGWFGPGIVDKLVGHMNERVRATTDEKKIAADLAARELQAQVDVTAAVETRRRIEAGHWSGRAILLLAMIPPTVYLAGIYWVSLFPEWGWTIARLPQWLETMMTVLVPSYILGVAGPSLAIKAWRR